MTNSDRKSGDLEFRSGRRHVTQARKNQSADGVDSFGVNFKAKMFAQIVQTRVTAHEKFAFAESLDVKLRTIAGRDPTENFLDDILHGDDSFNASEFVNHYAHALGMREKKLEQFHRAHRLRDKGRCDQSLGIMVRWIEQEKFYVNDAEDLIRRIGINGHAPMSF